MKKSLLMKRTILSLMVLAVSMTAMCVTKPDFNSDTYYILMFQNSRLYLTGGVTSGANMKIQEGSLDSYTDRQVWKFVGTASQFQLVNKAGQYVTIASEGDLLKCSKSEDSKGWALDDRGSTIQIQWLGSGSSSHRFINQYGSPHAGGDLDLWSDGDVNNQIIVIDPLNPDFQEFSVSPARSFSPESKMTMWYDAPATAKDVANQWMEYSLPIGNGELGASLYGGIKTDEIQFNEKTLWTGNTSERGQYKNFGSIFVEDRSGQFGFSKDQCVRDYWRSLDLEQGVSKVHFTSTDGQTSYDRTYLASNPDKVVAVRYTAEGNTPLHFFITMQPGEGINASSVVYYSGDSTKTTAFRGDSTMANINFSGSLEVVKYQARLQVVSDGIVERTAEGIDVSGAREVVLYLAAKTSFTSEKASRTTGAFVTQLLKDNQNTIRLAMAKGFDALCADHVRDYRSLIGRVDFHLESGSSRTTEELVKYYNTLSDLDNPEARFLEQLYFHFGRYLEVSCSRGMNVPSNLQGLWNNKSDAPWGSDIHTNINVQMNYWPAETTNLSETHLPFLNYIIDNAASASWKNAARRWGNVQNGWTVLTESNIYGGMTTWGSNYVVANAWYCSHLWQHFRFTRDEEFLARAFPAMWSCAQFWMERMIEDRGYDSKKENSGYKGTPYSFSPDGTFVAPQEFSPEQHANSHEDGTAHAQQLIYSLFSSVRQAADILGDAVTGLSGKDISKLDEYLSKTDNGLHTETYTANTALNGNWTNPRNGVKKDDIILREWKYSPYDVSDDPGHRHLSHLMCLYPLVQIGPSSPYFTAAVNSLRLRGDAATGWSMGWKICLWAHALDGNHAHTILKNALRHSTSYGTDQSRGGIYYNLYDSHSPFQIDGNFGSCAGIGEMLLQSQTDTLLLLPALPKEWASGHIHGMKAVGNFEVDEDWAEGRLTKASILSGSGMTCAIQYEGIAGFYITDEAGREVAFTRIDANTIKFPTTSGARYHIYRDKASDIREAHVTLSPSFGFAQDKGTLSPQFDKAFNLLGLPVDDSYRGAVILCDSSGKYRKVIQ